MLTYKILPLGETFKISKYAGIVPLPTAEEQMALTNDIDKNGLLEPIRIYKGEIVDGRSRQKSCVSTNTRIRYIELDHELTEKEVIVVVKSLNTRRNLTNTQKVISAVKEYFRQKENGLKVKQADTATAWGISLRLLASGIYIYKAKNSLIEPLFNGLSVELITPNGKKIKTSTISKIQKVLKDIENSMLESETTFDPASKIKTQEGRDWFFSRTKLIGSANGEIMKDLAELANYKFNDEVRLNQDTGEVN